MGAIASKITSLTIVYSTVYSDADQRKHQSSASLAFVRGIHRWPVNSPRKWPVTWKMFPFDDVIMYLGCWLGANYWTDTYLELGRHRVVKRHFVTRSTISIWSLCLTHRGLKMAVNVQVTFSTEYFLNETDCILIQISLILTICLHCLIMWWLAG